MAKRKVCRCGKQSIPGLIRGVSLCQYHYNERQWGKAWADKVKAEPNSRAAKKG